MQGKVSPPPNASPATRSRRQQATLSAYRPLASPKRSPATDSTKWGLRRQTVLAASLAIGGGGETFALPVFNPPRPHVPNVQEDGTVEYIGQGEIEVRILSGNEVYWEPGVDFYDSRWWAIQQARAISELRRCPGSTASSARCRF